MRPLLFIGIVAAISIVGAQSPQPPRDTPAQPPAAPTGKISGTVVTADTGKPVKRARVFVSATELPGGRATLTDDGGRFELSDLPAGRYSVTASKSGFITLSWGQRRPLQAGTPLQLGDGQQMKGVDFRLPRGGAIAGRISDEDGEPIPGATVRVMRYQYQQGDRRLVQAGGGQTDDKGQYRVWGLMPADYYVTATARGFGGAPAFGGGRFGGPGGPGPGGGRFGGGFGAAFSSEEESVAYAPTYYPGVPSVTDATRVTLGISQEMLDVSFMLQLVRTARITGKVTNADGTAATNGTVTLTADGSGGAGGGRGQIGINYGGRIQWDGAFTIGNVPPGRYVLRARGGDDDRPQYSEQPLTVSSGDVSGVVVSLSRGASISGTVQFQSTQLAAPDPTAIRITAPPADQGQFAANAGRVEKDGQFTFDGVPAGSRFIRATGAPRGWSLKSVIVAGRDVIDTPIEVRAGETIRNVSLVFSDSQTQLSGTVATERGVPVTDYTVLAFPMDQTFWRPQSRYIMTARPDQNGSYQIRGLPPGEYYMALVDPAEQGEWFEPAFLDAHRPGAARISLGEGESKNQDFKLK